MRSHAPETRPGPYGQIPHQHCTVITALVPGALRSLQDHMHMTHPYSDSDDTFAILW